MKSIYITSVDPYSGKTAFSLVLGRLLKDRGFKIGYMKPLSFQPWRYGDKVADEDAAFVRDILQLPYQPWDLSPIVMTSEYLSECLQVKDQVGLMEEITTTAERISEGKDVMIYEGGGSLREGYVVNLPAVEVAKKLNSKVLAIVRYKDRRHLLDDIRGYFRFLIMIRIRLVRNKIG